MTDVGGIAYFLANDGTHSRELWKSDGTDAGTSLVKDINPGGGDSNIVSMTDVGGTLYFAADDGTHGHELWKSDGTEAGTTMVADINSGSSDSVAPEKFANLGGTVYFGANDGTHGVELWKSDGTEAGTTLVKNISPFGLDSEPIHYPRTSAGRSISAQLTVLLPASTIFGAPTGPRRARPALRTWGPPATRVHAHRCRRYALLHGR